MSRVCYKNSLLTFLSISTVSKHPLNSAPCSIHIKRHGRSHNNALSRSGTQANRVVIPVSTVSSSYHPVKTQREPHRKICHKDVPHTSFYLPPSEAITRPRRTMPCRGQAVYAGSRSEQPMQIDAVFMRSSRPYIQENRNIYKARQR